MTETKTLPTDLTEQVTAFHRRFGYFVRGEPHIPVDIPSAELEPRLRLMTAEFCAVLRAFGLCVSEPEHALVQEIKRVTATDNQPWSGTLLSNIARRLADLDYTVEGTRLTLGIPRVPVAAEVHRANMDKVPAIPASPVRGPGWEPPRITELLQREKMAADD